MINSGHQGELIDSSGCGKARAPRLILDSRYLRRCLQLLSRMRGALSNRFKRVASRWRAHLNRAHHRSNPPARSGDCSAPGENCGACQANRQASTGAGDGLACKGRRMADLPVLPLHAGLGISPFAIAVFHFHSARRNQPECYIRHQDILSRGVMLIKSRKFRPALTRLI
jgi:hypothetical protein